MNDMTHSPYVLSSHSSALMFRTLFCTRTETIIAVSQIIRICTEVLKAEPVLEKLPGKNFSLQCFLLAVFLCLLSQWNIEWIWIGG